MRVAHRENMVVVIIKVGTGAEGGGVAKMLFADSVVGVIEANVGNSRPRVEDNVMRVPYDEGGRFYVDAPAVFELEARYVELCCGDRKFALWGGLSVVADGWVMTDDEVNWDFGRS